MSKFNNKIFAIESTNFEIFDNPNVVTDLLEVNSITDEESSARRDNFGNVYFDLLTSDAVECQYDGSGISTGANSGMFKKYYVAYWIILFVYICSLIKS